MEVQMALPQCRELPSETRAEQHARLLATVGPPRRGRYVLAVAVTLAVIAAAPTLAFQRELVDFWSAEPAPERIQLDWEKMRQSHAELRANGSAAPRYTPEGPAREVMTLMLDGEARPLSVVPTTEGGFCYRLHFHGSCLTPELAGGRMKIGVGGLSTRQGHGFDWVVGSVTESSVEELELVYQDGERVKVSFVWVSPPIDAGFYAYDVPVEHERVGRLTVGLVGLDEDGDEVAHACLPLPPEELARSVPAVASLCARRQAGRSRP